MPSYTSGNDAESSALINATVIGRAQDSIASTATQDDDRVAAGDAFLEVRLSNKISKQVMAQVAPNDSGTLATFVNDAVVVYLQLAALRQTQGELLFRVPATGEVRRIILPFEQAAETKSQNAGLNHDQLVATSVNKVQK